MEDKGVICKSMVWKKDGGLRLRTNLRWMNAQTLRDAPSLSRLLCRTSGHPHVWGRQSTLTSQHMLACTSTTWCHKGSATVQLCLCAWCWTSYLLLTAGQKRKGVDWLGELLAHTGSWLLQIGALRMRRSFKVPRGNFSTVLCCSAWLSKTLRPVCGCISGRDGCSVISTANWGGSGTPHCIW